MEGTLTNFFWIKVQIRYPNHFAFAIMILNVQMMVCQKIGSNKKAAIIAALNGTNIP